MRLSFDFWSILFICAASQGYFLFFVLFLNKRGSRPSNRLLAFLILVITILLTESLLSKLGFFTIDDHRHYIFFTTPVIYLIGPLFYLYSQSLFVKNLKIGLNSIYHFLPSLLCFINYLPAYLILLGFKPLPFQPLIDSQYFFIWISGYVDMALNILQTSIYLVFVLRVLREHEHNLKHLYSNNASLYVEWLRTLTFLMLSLMGVFTAALLFFLLTKYVASVENILALSRAVVIYAIGYITLNQSEIISGVTAAKLVEKYQHSPLSNEKAQLYVERLLQIMDSEKPYLNSDLKLPDLASRLSISTNHLSQVLNQNLQLNFFDFVNQYRVKEAQQKLLDPQFSRLTNLAIAFESGFSSKASFNRVFKKYTGKTPSQFVKSHSLQHQL